MQSHWNFEVVCYTEKKWLIHKVNNEVEPRLLQNGKEKWSRNREWGIRGID